MCIRDRGKAASFYFVDFACNYKSLWVNLKNQIIEYRKLAVGNNRHNNRLFGLFQAGHCMDEGGTTVDLLMDHLVNLLIFRADHHNLSLFLAHKMCIRDSYRLDRTVSLFQGKIKMSAAVMIGKVGDFSAQIQITQTKIPIQNTFYITI